MPVAFVKRSGVAIAPALPGVALGIDGKASCVSVYKPAGILGAHVSVCGAGWNMGEPGDLHYFCTSVAVIAAAVATITGSVFLFRDRIPSGVDGSGWNARAMM